MYCLFASFGQVKSTTYYVNSDLYGIPFEYRRPSVHKSQMAICFKCWKLVKITKVEPKKEYYSSWGRWVYEVESKDLMKNHWNYSCFKAETTTMAENTIPSAPNFEPACISPTRQEMILPTSYQSSGLKGITSDIFILSQYAKQNNLLPSTKGTVLRLRDGTKVTIV